MSRCEVRSFCHAGADSCTAGADSCTAGADSCTAFLSKWAGPKYGGSDGMPDGAAEKLSDGCGAKYGNSVRRLGPGWVREPAGRACGGACAAPAPACQAPGSSRSPAEGP